MSNLISLLDKFHIPYKTSGHRHVRNGWVGVDCPSCSPGSGKYRLGFNLASGRASCWVDGRQDPVKMLALLCNVEIREAIGLWKDLPRTFDPQRVDYTGVLKLPESGPMLQCHLEYLKGRGFDPDEIQRLWGVSGIGFSDELAWRILIPIHSQSGKIVSWTTRSIGQDAKNRYISAKPEQEAINHKDLLYGSHHALHSVVVCEGPVSAWAVGPGAVATLGVNYSDRQLAAIAEYPMRAICFDSVPDAQKRAERLCRDLSAMPGVTENIVLDSGKDPAECDKSEVLEIRSKFLI